MCARTVVETILMAPGDHWTRPGVNQEPAAEAGGGCLRLAPLPPRHMCRSGSQRSAQVLRQYHGMGSMCHGLGSACVFEEW